jgi:hypothetical protein
MAVKAAGEQGDPARYLRRLREGFMCRRRRLDTAEALVEEARPISGLDLERFRLDLSSNAIVEAFGADLDRAAAAGVTSIPSLEFRGEDGGVHGVSGFASYAELGAAARAAGAVPAPDALSVEDALRRFGALATPEVAAVCDLPGPQAPAELWRLALEWRVKAERLGSGEMWSLA